MAEKNVSRMLGLLYASPADEVVAADEAEEMTWSPLLPLPLPPRPPVGTDGKLMLALSDWTDIDAAERLVERLLRFKIVEGLDRLVTESDAALVSRLTESAGRLRLRSETEELLRATPGTEIEGTETLGADAPRLVDGAEMLFRDNEGALMLSPGEVSEMLRAEIEGALRSMLVDGADNVGANKEGSEAEDKVVSNLIELREMLGIVIDARPRLVLGALSVMDGTLPLGRVIEGAFRSTLVEGIEKVEAVMLAET